MIICWTSYQKRVCLTLIFKSILFQHVLNTKGTLVFGDNVKLTKKVYVGNLSFNTTEDDVRELFGEYGNIESVAWITDRDTGRFRGFCFVEIEDAAAAKAISALDGKEIDGRNLKVNEARPREERGGGGGRRGGGGGYNRGGGNRGGGGGYNRDGGGRGDNRFPDSGGSRW
ncbi:MAG: hypothetical protein KC419_00870 [Anaerolineales bacterium]|nr:hypothetical protein [Anaerolineales bacterium]MCA9926988.1 hypothetical protein [Anaerolineales bacterium]